MSHKFEIIVVGDYCLDLIFTGMEEQPQLGREITSKAFNMTPGGSYNTAIACRRLGIDVAWACDFGIDHFSQFVLENAIEEGIDTSLFIYHNKPVHKITVALSYPEDRAFIAYYDPDETIPAGVKGIAKANAKILYLPGLYYGEALNLGLMLVKSKRMKLVMDGNHQADVNLEDKNLQKALKATQIFMPNSEEVRRITGEVDLIQGIQTLAAFCPVLIVKDGTRGAYACQKGKIIHAPAIPIQPVDTTGAGDCFNAGFLFSWLREEPLEKCLRWGNVVGGLSTLAVGGTGKVIHQEDVNQYLETHLIT